MSIKINFRLYSNTVRIVTYMILFLLNAFKNIELIYYDRYYTVLFIVFKSYLKLNLYTTPKKTYR